MFKVSLDFEINFPNANHDFPKKFQENSAKLVEVLRKSIKNDFVKALMGKLDGVNENAKVAIIILALHSFLYSHKSIGGKGFRRPAMLDSVSYMMMVTNRPNVQLVINERQEEMSKMGLTLQPFIIVQGETYSDVTDNIVLVLDNNKYLFKSILSALASLLKCYELFDLEWPAANAPVYTFLEYFFLNIISNAIPTKVEQLVQQLCED